MATTDIDTSPRVTEVLGSASDLPPGMRKIFRVKDMPILVINDNGTYYAITAVCSYFDPLEPDKFFQQLKVLGVYYDGRIRCRLHGGCYNMRTGELEDYPALDGLQTYDVS
ncbi:rieske [2Fe-2S] domain protein [Cooperia oncophora]